MEKILVKHLSLKEQGFVRITRATHKSFCFINVNQPEVEKVDKHDFRYKDTDIMTFLIWISSIFT